MTEETEVLPSFTNLPISDSAPGVAAAAGAGSGAGIIRHVRSAPPTDFTLKIECFSQLLATLSERVPKTYQSSLFEAGGYKWRLCLYPDGDKESDGDGFISLYLVLAEKDNLPDDLEVNVEFKLFAYDQIRDNYLTVQGVGDAAVSRFNKTDSVYGFTQFIALSIFNNASNGYLKDDTCMFGAEVVVLKGTAKCECYSMANLSTDPFMWRIPHFSSLKEAPIDSQGFQGGTKKWMLRLFPKGDQWHAYKNLSVYLCMGQDIDSSTRKSREKVGCVLRKPDKLRVEQRDEATAPPDSAVFIECELCVCDQLNGQHQTKTVIHWFNANSTWAGFGDILDLSMLKDESSGLLVNDNLLIKVYFRTFFEVNSTRFR